MNEAFEKNNLKEDDSANHPVATGSQETAGDQGITENREEADTVLTEEERRALERKAAEDEQRMMAYREKKAILRGIFGMDDEGRIAVTDDYFSHFGFGINDGALRVTILGISGKRRRYVKTSDVRKHMKAAQKAMQDLGREVYLFYDPAEVVCYVKSLLFRPGLLIFEITDNIPTARIYTGRGLLSFISRNYYLKKFEKLMGESLIRDNNQPQDDGSGLQAVNYRQMNGK